jgi:hypothetical protein
LGADGKYFPRAKLFIQARKGQGFGVKGGEKGEARCCDGCYAGDAMAPKTYFRRWAVYLRGERLGEVLAATERAACLRAVQRFKISREDQKELQVRAEVPDGR